LVAATGRARKVLDELGIPPKPIEDHRMIMVRHRAGQQYLDLAPLRCFYQAVRERIVGGCVRRSKNCRCWQRRVIK
jgi:hypothetical protein